MSNRLYLLSSLCFLTGSVLAFRTVQSTDNGVYILGSALFVAAAAVSVFGKK